ncbi:glycosyl transferase, group 1 family protein [Myxococcus xanthus DK 1622]|uniref:Glycosyl transferase, group 1 family protein n=1 Tax=Myxococcus xanthus (strain DK1622) TaxID=246197 RepID=Q1CZ47_MYXXD|nr:MULTISPECIES: N-acetyl-alpha-D-glucosaminyl L-malate synthase BshA [Myxococcus]ABF92721.1 glycosyl transferase, group 1 family protein [Myxococcus xanthus DK 1622]NOJ54398.1 N-acetyl-alpha-D-glucosaminyl L-malate synthase BshA [Myxococcus xanthus]QPM78578.1 N-acetyl-alpha-D-glucosaminyl L-malate synthase BshA [Myxococcus xanthus]QVW67648.1 N-acetyl-alpha-D-glucosaminyl L-malate synthase BshA [Myxococcus xanthus DZ2]QZZ53827.1 N-acetyl-alpha-D-glucosaminyl L-malate synthase [Myxococcus xanth
MNAPLNVAITCFPTFGGSGMVATEIGLAMADRGHRVHFIARDLPVRLHGANRKVVFHEVTESDYPALQQSGTYPIALASKMIEVASYERLDILHVHYAVPHATAAWMAREVLGHKAPRVVTTLHGTDTTLVGIDPSYLPITRFSITRSDAVTVPSAYLRRATWRGFDIPESVPIDVIANFVDTARYAPVRDRACLRALFPALRDHEPVLIHVSNFRPVKRITDVVAIFTEVHRHRPCRLVMVGDGPERSPAERMLREMGLEGRVAFLGKQDRFEELVAASDVFLLPSEQESFGLAALEALSCGIPVVASDLGGIPELVTHGETGFLAPLGDVPAMARHVLTLVEDAERWQGFSHRARAQVLERFQKEPAIDRYEALYRRLLTGPLRR